MSLKSQESIGTNQRKVVFVVDRPTFDAAVEKVYQRQAKNITIPGFRKGKAPRALIEKMYGKEVFFEDAVNASIPDAWENVRGEITETIVSRPEFEVVTIDENGAELAATYYVKPDVAISDYLGIPVTRPVYPVTDEDVNAEVERIRTRNARMIEITDRAAQADDIVNIDFDGYMDGEPFEGGKASGHQLTLGSGQFIPGFEDQIVGHSVGDEFDVNVNFPETYHEEKLAGKPAVFKVKLNGIKFSELPDVDDEFARDVSEFDTLDEYRADIRKRLEESNKKRSDNEVDEALINALIEKLQAEIPSCMIDSETENQVRDYDNRLRMNGLDLKTYFKYTGLDLDTLREQMRPGAEKQVKTRLALEKIAALEAVAVSDEEIEAEYGRLAEQFGMESDKIKEAVDRDSIVADLKVKGAIELVRAKAVETEEIKTKEAPADKAE